MQTVLGANGVIGRELSRNLPKYTNRIRQAGRHPKKFNDSDELVTADLMNFQDTCKAVEGSEIVYLVAGLTYNTKVWRAQWPVVMRNVIDACKKSGSKLVFFDNVYAYGLVKGPMTEQTPFNPNSQKGEIRAEIATLLLDEIKSGNIHAMIIRAADFYGPGAILSLIHSMVSERLKSKKSPQWIGDPKRVHTFTYTPDAGKSVAMLGNSPQAFNQTWHALTSQEKITGEQLIRIACAAAKRPYAKQVLPKFGVRLLGLFVPILREFVEMMYQFEEDYVFDSTRFETTFTQVATPYDEGIGEIFK